MDRALTLSDILLDIGDAERTADGLRRDLHAAQRAGDPVRLIEGKLCATSRRIVTLNRQRRAVLAAIDSLAGQITLLASAGLDHDDEEMRRLEQRALDLLGCESLNPERWPYAAAALRAREQPEDVEAFIGFVMARHVLLGSERRAA